MQGQSIVQLWDLKKPGIIVPPVPPDFFHGDGAGLPQLKVADRSTRLWLAEKYTPTHSYTIAGVSMSFGRTLNPTGILTAAIYSHNAGSNQPDALIGSGSSNSLNSATIAVFPALTSFQFNGLAAPVVLGQSYWIVIKASVWTTNSDFTNVKCSSLTLAHAAMISGDSGATWTQISGTSNFDYDFV